MIKTLATALFLFISYFIVAQNVSLEDVWLTYKFYPASLDDISSMSNGESYTINENGESIVQYSFKTGKSIKTLFSLNQINATNKPSKIEAYAFSDDEKSILIASEKERIYRHSSLNKYYLYNIQNKEL